MQGHYGFEVEDFLKGMYWNFNDNIEDADNVHDIVHRFNSKNAVEIDEGDSKQFHNNFRQVPRHGTPVQSIKSGRNIEIEAASMSLMDRDWL